MIDANGIILTHNAELARRFGRDGEDMVGTSTYELTSPDISARRREQVLEVIAKKQSIRFEDIRSGQIIHHSLYPVFDANGEVSAIAIYAKDITEQKTSEIALRESERLLRESQQIAGLGSYLLDISTGIWNSSDVLDQVFGIDSNFTRNLTGWINLVHPDDRKLLLDYFTKEVVERGQSFDQEYRIIRANDGAVRWVHDIGKVEFNEAGVPSRMRGTIQDITERKHAEQELIQNDQRLRTLVSILQYPAENIQEFLNHSLEQAIQLTNSQIGYLYYYSETTKEFTLHAWSTSVMQACTIQEPQVVYQLDKTGLWGEAVRQRKPIIVNDFQAANPYKKGYPEGHAPLQKFITVPILQGAEIQGVIGLANKATDYDETDVLQISLLMESVWKVVTQQEAENQLREREGRYRSLFESMSSTFSFNEILLDDHGKPVDFRFLEVNRALAESLHLPIESVVGKRFSEITAQIDPDWIEICGRVALSGIPTQFEKYSKTTDSTLDFSIYSPRRKYFAVVGNDITDSKRLLRVTEQAASQWQQTFDSVTDAVWILDKDQRVLRSNQAAECYFNMPCKDMVCEHCYTIVHHDDEPIYNCPLLRSKESGKRESMELLNDGRWLQVTVDPIFDDGGNFDGAVHIVSDITERKLSESALMESEARFRVLSTMATEGIFIHRNGIILESNDATARIFGFDRVEDLIGQHGTEVIQFSDTSKQLVLEHLKKSSSESYEAEFIKPDGTIGYIETHGSDIVYQGESARIVYVRDIADRKLAAAEHEKLQQQLAQSQKMESVGRLAGGVAHDFNNMLNVIIGHAELSLDSIQPDHPVHAGLEEIRSAAKRSADLTRQLLAFARKQTVAPKVLDLNETISGMIKMLRRLIGENIDLNWHPGEALWQVRVDPSQIDQVLANLCVNSRDAISGIGQIVIRTENRTIDEEYCLNHTGYEPGEYVCIQLSDTGCGMDSETLSHIFEPFFTTKDLGKGTGLGLATVYGAVKQNRGMVNVHSEVGVGTTFSIYLPRHVPKYKSVKPESSSSKIVGGTETILVVEDEPAILRLTVTILESHGYTVYSANTPGDAVQIAKEHLGEIDMLLLDVIMPEMNGRDLAKTLLFIDPKLKLLFMSGYTSDIISHHGVLDDTLNFIQKPFTLKDLAVKVREVLDQNKIG